MTKAVGLQPQRADACQHLGLYLMEIGRTKEAVTYLSRALQLESSPANFANLGTAMLKLGEVEQAASLSARAASMRPEMGEYHFNSGLALAAAGKRTEAIAALEARNRTSSPSRRGIQQTWNALQRNRTVGSGDQETLLRRPLDCVQAILPLGLSQSRDGAGVNGAGAGCD